MSELIVTTEQGKVRGRIGRDYHGGEIYSFLGIPYAKAPTGNLRFKEPQPPEPWKCTFNAIIDGPSCPHWFEILNLYRGREDNCLNLNVYMKQSNGNLPVIVFIHGGGFIQGSNDRWTYGPNHLLTADVVLVVINYRLGLLGFLSLEDRSLNVPGNNGLKDQVMALKWVQKNIHNFGGDPNNVTIAGESAGSAAVHYLMMSPLAKGLFHKAILQSGSALNPWARGRRNALDIAMALNYSVTTEKEILENLMKENVKTIVKAQFKEHYVFFAGVVHPYGPVIEYEHENAFLSKDPMKIMKSGDYNKVPVIIGHNSMEGILFEYVRKIAGFQLPRSLECDVPYYLDITKGSKQEKEIAERIRQFYYKDEEISEKNIAKRYLIMGDTNFNYGILKTTQLMSLHHPVYFYRNSLDGKLCYFKRISLSSRMRTSLILTAITSYIGIGLLENLVTKCLTSEIPGVCHADEIFCLFSTSLNKHYAKGSEEDVSIQKFVKLWTDFAKSSNPTPKAEQTLDNIIWKPVSRGNIEPVFNIDFKVEEQEKNSEMESFEFWEKIHEGKL